MNRSKGRYISDLFEYIKDVKRKLSLLEQAYHFDGCIHWLVETKPSVSIYHLWNELLDMEKLDV